MSDKKLKRIPDYTFLGCPLTRNRSPWCFRICAPAPQKLGECGRVAPHAIKSRIQLGIEEFERRKKQSAEGQPCQK
jgi:hypothetical protein